jgi:hypothetical protein
MAAATAPIATSSFKKKEEFVLIWFDANIDDSLDSIETQSMFRELNSNVLFFTDVKSAIGLIESDQYEQMILVVSDAFVWTVLPLTRKIRSLQAVFIFGRNPQVGENLLKQYTSIVGIFDSRTDLLKSIQETIPLLEKQLLTFTMFDQTQRLTKDLTKESNAFLWYQVLFYVLRQMPADQQAKDEMLELCRSYYRGNKIELQKIERYRECQSVDQTISW